MKVRDYVGNGEYIGKVFRNADTQRRGFGRAGFYIISEVNGGGRDIQERTASIRISFDTDEHGKRAQTFVKMPLSSLEDDEEYPVTPNWLDFK